MEHDVAYCQSEKSVRVAKEPMAISFEVYLFIALLAVVNTKLLVQGSPDLNLIFDPGAVSQGEWWRLLSWPLIHVSRYHLLLDGLAFVLLYLGLKERRLARRLLWVASCVIGSLLLPLIFSAEIVRIGLCGLSGAAHGLAAISGLEMFRDKRQRRAGAVLIGVLALKVGYELLSGQVIMQGVHFGFIGIPLVTTHAGGLIGGVAAFLLNSGVERMRAAFR